MAGWRQMAEAGGISAGKRANAKGPPIDGDGRPVRDGFYAMVSGAVVCQLIADAWLTELPEGVFL